MGIINRHKNLITKMEKEGYYYDDLESTENCIRFFYTGMVFPLIFGSWQDVTSYLEETVFD